MDEQDDLFPPCPNKAPVWRPTAVEAIQECTKHYMAELKARLRGLDRETYMAATHRVIVAAMQLQTDGLANIYGDKE